MLERVFGVGRKREGRADFRHRQNLNMKSEEQRPGEAVPPGRCLIHKSHNNNVDVKVININGLCDPHH